MTDLVLYKDKDLKEPFTIENLGTTEAGNSRKVEAWLHNSSVNDIVQIEYETADVDVHIHGLPESLRGESWQRVMVEYSPNKMRTTALDTFVTFRGFRVVPPE